MCTIMTTSPIQATDIRTFVETAPGVWYAVVTTSHKRTGYPTADPILYRSEFITAIWPCHTDPQPSINWHGNSFAPANTDGNTFTKPQAMLLHMSAVSHVMEQDAYKTPSPHLVSTRRLTITDKA